MTILNRDTLKVIRAFGGFDEPHIAAVSPDGSYAYITDDARGTLTVIRLSDMHVTDTISVGLGAHQLAFSPTDRTVWIALGENAQQITELSTVVSRPSPPAGAVVNAGRPRVIGHFDPGFAAHDLAFSPDGGASGSPLPKGRMSRHSAHGPTGRCSGSWWARRRSISSSRGGTRTSPAAMAA